MKRSIQKSSTGKKNFLIFGLKLTITILLMVFLLSSVDLSRSMEILTTVHVLILFLAFALMTLNFVLITLNLREILYSYNMKGHFLRLLKLNYITQFFIFSGLGEIFGGLVKYRYLSRVTRINQLTALERITVVFFEKMITLVVTFLLSVCLFFIYYSDVKNFLSKLFFHLNISHSHLVLLCGAVLILFILKHFFMDHIRHFMTLLFSLLNNRRLIAKIVLNLSLLYINNIIINYIVFTSIGIDFLTLSDIAVLYLFIFLSQFLPISIGGLGVKENIVVYVMLFYNVSPEQSVAFSMICLFITMIHSLFGGILFLTDHARKTGFHLSIPSEAERI